MEKEKTDSLMRLHFNVMVTLTENGVSFEVRQKVAEVLEEYMAYSRAQAQQMMLMAQRLM